VTDIDMLRVGLVSNRLSHRTRRHLETVSRVIQRYPQAFVHEAFSDFRALPEALARIAAEQVDVLALLAGDGTAHAVLTHLLADRPFAMPPPLLMLSGGMTNMTAADVGPRMRPDRALRWLVEEIGHAGLAERLIHRPILRVENAAGFPPQYGMFFGTAAIVRAIELCRSRVHSVGLEAEVANTATLVAVLFHHLTSKRGSDLFRGDDIAISIDGGTPVRGPHLIVLATTLERLAVGSRPFWGEEREAIHFTSVAHPARGLLGSASRILYGWPDRRLDDGTYVSRNVSSLALDMRCPFTLDGQLFEPEPGRPVRLAAEDVLAFIR
jgi:hypothetical protein